MRFVGSGKPGKRAQDSPTVAGADASTAELWRSAKQIHAEAARATQSGNHGEALELLDGLIWRLQNTSPDFASQEIAKSQSWRAIALHRLGRFEDAVAACNVSLAWYCAREERPEEFEQQVELVLKTRLFALGSVHIDDADRVQILEESISLMRSLPATSERAGIWLKWTNELFKTHLRCGDAAGATRLIEQIILQLPAVGLYSVTNQFTAKVVMLFVSDSVTVAEFGEPELASQLVEQCSLLLGDASSIAMTQGERLIFARRTLVNGHKLQRLGITDSAMKLFGLAIGLYRGIVGLQGQEAKQRWFFAICLNGYAWALAGRGESEAALPTAQEAVDWARGCVDDEAGPDERGMLETLAESLDTLATVYAQLGDLAAAREPALESQALKRQLADSDNESSRSSAERTDKLVALIERGPSEDHAAWLRSSAP